MKKVEGKIVGIEEETHDVKTFEVELEETIDFIPGQYCLVSMKDKEELEGEKRPFTFSNPPEKTKEKKLMDLTVKKIGEFTTAMHNLDEGAKVIIRSPRGESLNFDESVKEDIVFLAGGSGITPFMSALRFAVNQDLENTFTLFFSNRTERDIIYREELGKMDKRENIEVIHSLEEFPGDWKGEEGRIDKEMISKHVSDPLNRLWYICGPPPMVEAMVKILEKLGVPGNKIKWEDWQISGKHDD